MNDFSRLIKNSYTLNGLILSSYQNLVARFNTFFRDHNVGTANCVGPQK